MSLERTSGVASVLAGVLPALVMAVIFAPGRDGVLHVDRQAAARDARPTW